MRTFLTRVAAVAAAAASALVMTTGAAQAEVRAAAPDSNGELSAQVTKLTHSQALSRLRSSNITWSSSGGCSDRNRPNCTSFEQINLATIQGIQTLKKASKCAINVTGGTETGHASGTYSHWNGYKLDTSLSNCLNKYIQGTFASIGGSKWKSASGNIYYKEGNHWDITYYNCGGC